MRASEFGGCIRGLVAKELGYTGIEPPVRIREVFQRGNEAEDKAFARLADAGWLVIDRQREVVFMGITGHIDGRSLKFGTIEVKSFSADQYKKWVELGFEMGGFMDRYKWQASVYWHALDPNPFTMIGYNRETGSMYQRTIHQPFYAEIEIAARIAEIETWADRGELPPCDRKPDNYACPFRDLHLPEVQERDELIEGLGETYAGLKEQESVIDAQLTRCRKALEAALGDRETVDCPNVKVSVYWQKNPDRADLKALRAAGLDRYVTVGEKSKRLKVTLRKVAD